MVSDVSTQTTEDVSSRCAINSTVIASKISTTGKADINYLSEWYFIVENVHCFGCHFPGYVVGSGIDSGRSQFGGRRRFYNNLIERTVMLFTKLPNT